jgi:hypothetical protein
MELIEQRLGAAAAAAITGLMHRSPAAVKCVEAVRMSVELPMRDGLRREIEIFKELVQSPESRALQYGFFSERAAGRKRGSGLPRPRFPYHEKSRPVS